MSGVPLFLYGTLQHRPLMELLAGDLGDAASEGAVLPGYRVVREEGGDLPVLVEHAEGNVFGVLWTGLSEAARARLDAYGVPFGFALRVVAPLVDGVAIKALTYGPPAGLAASGTDWSLDVWIEESSALPMHRAAEIAAMDPPLAGDAMLAQGPMMDHRAAATLRAEAAVAPTTLRRRAAPGDVAWRRLRPPTGGFFRFEGLALDHVRFDGARATDLLREVLVGADAALVLPYDAARNRVLLVEQVRPGPARRGDPQSWILEPVAGLIDAGETPEEAARREAEEEAGLTLDALIPMFAGYASPGDATDHFYAFLAPCDLPDGHATTGGLASENEDLALHLVGFDDAMGLVDSGEANAVPLISMLLWLDRWRRKAAG